VDISETRGKEMMSHYIFIESEGDPSTDPVIVWSNGGPGASSLFGIMAELGPLLLNDNSLTGAQYKETGVPTLFYNNYTWTKFGSVLMFDWPPPVGFSYCNGDPSGDGYSCGSWNDTSAADAEYAALQAFYDVKFPELKSNDLFLTGESYAGVYIPMLAQRVLNGLDTYPLSLKGVAVGDACTGSQVLCGGDTGMGPWWSVIFFYGHGQFSNVLFDSIVDVCTVPGLKTGDYPDPDACTPLLSQMYTEIGGYYDYNLYDDCIYDDDIRRRQLSSSSTSTPSWIPNDGAALNDYVCGGGNAQNIWAAAPQVIEALNIPSDAFFFTADNGDGMVYNLTETNLMPFYIDVANNYPDVRVLVYNGDTDPGINSFISQNWTVSLGLSETESWRPWTLDGCLRMGGYVTRYKGDFNFLTIRGSGHMVPQFKPEAAFEFMGRFISNEEWQTYDSSCTAPSTAKR
jgi:hypothetical protein